MRPRTACSSCRQRQRRCIVQDNARNAACSFCLRNKHECSLVASSSSPTVERAHEQKNQSPTASLPSCSEISSPDLPPPASFQEETTALAVHSGLRMPPTEAYLEIASNYFTYIHDPSHNIFHRPSFMADFLSLVTLRTALLLGAFYGTEGDSLHESLYYSLACRIGSLLNIPNSTFDTPLSREVGIRIWWTLDIVDVWSSNSLQLPRLLNPKKDVAFPTSERAFFQMRRSHSYLQFSSFESQEESSTSVFVQKIKLNPILSEIAQLNRTLAENTLSLHETHAATEALALRLNEWREQLPESLTDTPENLFAQSASGSGGVFVALHIGFYHFSQLLYFYYLHQSVSGYPTTESNVFAERCRESSTAFCELLYAAQALPGAEVYYSMVGHALVISSTVQLHILLFTDNEEQSYAARQRLEKNFVILSRLQKLWRTVDHSFARFQEFHGACMRTKADSEDPSTTFRMDKWMIQFLMEYSKPLEQRADLEYRSPASSTSYESDTVQRGYESEFRRWTSTELGIDFES
ncbi:hypothetical protein IFR05_003601 [Cadophora sp. M221]|nr:hypothetical protein IFR05_003601 [Cadophora sp. M221]